MIPVDRSDRRLTGWPVHLAVALLLAGCQPLPHPFADDRPPAALLQVRDVASVAIAPIEGKPAATAQKLSAAVAKALLKHEIPASERTTSLDSYQLYGQIAEAGVHNGSATVTVQWRLLDAKGRTVGERTVTADAQTTDWESGSAAPVDQLAGLTADKLAPLLEDEAPVEAPVGGHTRVVVGKISGAPGDGAASLANAITAVLKRQDLAIVEDDHKADLVVEGDVSVTPVKANKQHVKIVWRVRRVDGTEIGTVGQENDVPKGLLDGTWGDLAYSVAVAAGDGLMQLVDRGAPSPKS
jgi:hypothetical protein